MEPPPPSLSQAPTSGPWPLLFPMLKMPSHNPGVPGDTCYSRDQGKALPTSPRGPSRGVAAAQVRESESQPDRWSAV